MIKGDSIASRKWIGLSHIGSYKPRNQYKYLYQLPAINIEYITKNNLPKPEGKINFFIEDYEWEVMPTNNENYGK